MNATLRRTRPTPVPAIGEIRTRFAGLAEDHAANVGGDMTAYYACLSGLYMGECGRLHRLLEEATADLERTRRELRSAHMEIHGIDERDLNPGGWE